MKINFSAKHICNSKRPFVTLCWNRRLHNWAWLYIYLFTETWLYDTEKRHSYNNPVNAHKNDSWTRIDRKQFNRGVPFNIGILRPLAEQNSTEPEVENRTPANRVCSRDEGTTREWKRWIPLGCHPTHPLCRPPSIRGGRSHMYVSSGHGRPEGGKVIAGIQLMVDALVGLPQLLLDHAPARIARTSRWPNPVGHHRNFAEVQTTHTQRLLGAFWAAGSRRACGNRAAEVSEGERMICKANVSPSR